MTLSQRLYEFVQACFTGLWVETHEPDEAQRELAALAASRAEPWSVRVWDVAQGLYEPGKPAIKQAVGDPVAALKAFDGQEGQTRILLLHNYHRFLSNPIVIQHLFNAVLKGKEDRTFFVILAPSVQLPAEVEHVFTVLTHDLPTPECLHTIAQQCLAHEPRTEELSAIPAAAGLTRYEAEGAFALSLARHQRLDAESVWELKTAALKKSGLLTLHRGKERFDDLGGLANLKSFASKALSPARGVQPKGMLLLGVPGTGKSAFCKALGTETGRPVLILDVGSLMGCHVGETEGNVRRALQTADAMAPCILFIDEVEKALAGATSEHQGDNGVKAGILGTLLTWLNDHDSDVFTVCTSNDVHCLPAAFTRAERFDGVFFIDLPSHEEKIKIWCLYCLNFGHMEDRSINDVDDKNWTGAEIRSCCRLAALLNVPLAEAAQYVVPVAMTAADQVRALRQWASGRCLSASRPGIYHAEEEATKPTPRRRVSPIATSVRTP